jgi:hypothetical protein
VLLQFGHRCVLWCMPRGDGASVVAGGRKSSNTAAAAPSKWCRARTLFRGHDACCASVFDE